MDLDILAAPARIGLQSSRPLRRDPDLPTPKTHPEPTKGAGPKRAASAPASYREKLAAAVNATPTAALSPTEARVVRIMAEQMSMEEFEELYARDPDAAAKVLVSDATSLAAVLPEYADDLRTGFGAEFPPSRISMQVKAGLLEIPVPGSS